MNTPATRLNYRPSDSSTVASRRPLPPVVPRKYLYRPVYRPAIFDELILRGYSCWLTSVEAANPTPILRLSPPLVSSFPAPLRFPSCSLYIFHFSFPFFPTFHPNHSVSVHRGLRSLPPFLTPVGKSIWSGVGVRRGGCYRVLHPLHPSTAACSP